MKTIFTTICLLLSISVAYSQHDFDNQGIIYSKGNNVIAIGEGSTIGGSLGPGMTGLRVIGDDAAFFTFGKKNDGNYQVTMGGSNFGNAMYFHQNQVFDFWAGGTILSLKGTGNNGGVWLLAVPLYPQVINWLWQETLLLKR